MKISIRAKNIELNQELRDYVSEKIGNTLDKLLINEKSPLEAGVELIRLTYHHQKGQIFRAEAQVFLHGHQVIAEANGETIKEAIDAVKDELERDIKSHRSKEITLTRKRDRIFKRLMRLSPLARFKKKKK